MDQLQKCMDLDFPFTIVVDDPSGLSRFENPEKATRVEMAAELGAVGSITEGKEDEEAKEVDEDLVDFPKLVQN